MPLFYATRPSDEPVGWDSQRGRPVYEYTRFGRLQRARDKAVRQAQRVKGRAYSYDGERTLIYDAREPDNVDPRNRVDERAAAPAT